MSKFVLITGELNDGVRAVYGPFDTEEDAEDYGERYNLGHFPRFVIEIEAAKEKLIGVPCSCRGMTEAIELGLAATTTVTFNGKTSPSVGILTHETFSPFQWCPWCGNAAIEIKEANNDEERT